MSPITNEEDRIRKKSRRLFNMVWWLTAVIFWALVAFSPLGGSWPLPAAFWYALLAFILVQTVFHLLALRYLYPGNGRGNYGWVLAMPVMILLGIWLAVFLEIITGAALGGLK